MACLRDQSLIKMDFEEVFDFDNMDFILEIM